MAKDLVRLEISKKELEKYIYAIESSIDIVDQRESPLLFQYLNERIKLANHSASEILILQKEHYQKIDTLISLADKFYEKFIYLQNGINKTW